MKAVRMTWSVFVFILAVFTGCSENSDSGLDPGDPSTDGPARLELTIQHEHGAALASQEITLVYYSNGQTMKAVTDSAGFTVFDSLSVGLYEIGYNVLSISFADTVAIRKGEVRTKTIVIPALVDVEINVGDSSLTPWQSTEVTMVYPVERTSMSDESGIAHFEQVPLDSCIVTCTRYDITATDTLYYGSYLDGTITFTIDTQGNPLVDIVAAQNELTVNKYGSPVILEVYARDFQLGLLEGEQVEWSSDIDGFLGYGRELDLSVLSIGTHEITVTGDDESYWIYHEVVTDTISVYVVAESDESFFPITLNAYWNFEVVPSSIDVADNSGNDEHWELSSWEITRETGESITGHLTFEVTSENDTRSGSYSMTDTYMFEGNAILISQRNEQMTISHEQTGIQETITYTTLYDPALVLLSDHYDPLSTSVPSHAVTASVQWNYTNSVSGGLNHLETQFITASTEAGVPESVETPMGSMNAVPVTMTIDDEPRTMYFVQGAGVIKTETSSLGFPVHMTLAESSLGKVAIGDHEMSFEGRAGSATTQLNISDMSDPSSRLREYCRILHGLSAW